MGNTTAAGSERGDLLGQAGGGLGRALQGHGVAVGAVEMHGGGEMTQGRAGRPRAMAGQPRWTGEGHGNGRRDAVAFTMSVHGSTTTGSQV
jgi:hypothetical protein